MENGLTHQSPMPAVPPPEALESELDLIRASAPRLPDALRAVLTQDRPIDFRTVDIGPFDDGPREPRRYMWMRAIGAMTDSTLDHQATLAYASDYGLLATTVQPHGLHIRSPGLQAATLDHAIWFHQPFRMDEWLLYAMDSPASIFTRDGRLVVSVAQEGLIRMHDDDAARPA